MPQDGVPGAGTGTVGDPAQQPTANAPEIPTPPPAPTKSIFDVIYEASDVSIPKQRISGDIRSLIKTSGLEDSYDFIFLYDERSQITRFTSNRIYSAITGGAHD